ncbi:MAG: hypothetical protein Q8Q28_12455 [Pseudomonadota bacterium]|nr:hypothetical protein [Pseudomonadota bacterium]
MTATTTDRNAFDALCSLAAKEKWCWKIYCTTCGHMLFRYALHEILLGHHPDSSSWVVSQSHPVLSRGSQLKELGPLPPRWESWAIGEQHQLAQVLIGASIHDIRSSCSYPDWLGYLGLGLMYSKDAELETRAVTKSWVPQLLEEREGVHAQQLLRSIASSNNLVLTWRMLEVLE